LSQVIEDNRKRGKSCKDIKKLKVYGKRGVTGDFLFLPSHATLMVLEEAC